MASRRMPIYRKANKYKNKPIEIDGHTFPSRKEAQTYCQLRYLAMAGEITELQLQVPFELQPKFTNRRTGKTIRAIKYIADFVYKDKAGQMHIVDAKGYRTEVYEIKKKMMLYRGYEVEEV